jgi:hypothetical protein
MDKLIVDPEIIKLIRALQFYADPETYYAIGFFPDPPCGDFIEDFDELRKPGALARKTLIELNLPIEYEKYDDEPDGIADVPGYTGIQGNSVEATQNNDIVVSCNTCRWFNDSGIKPCGDCESFIYYEPIETCSKKYLEKFYVEEDDHKEFGFMVKDRRRILCRCAIKENADIIANTLNEKEPL